MNRRSFFAALLAPFFARLLPKSSPKPPEDIGLSIRYIHGYDASLEGFISRFDILYGTSLCRPEHVVRVSDNFFDPHLNPARLPA